MPSPPDFKISSGMPSGPTDFFFPIADKHLLVMLILMVKGLSDSVDLICGLLRLQLNRDTQLGFMNLDFIIGFVTSLPFWSPIVGILSLFPLHRLTYLYNSVQHLPSFCKTESKTVS
jgi:hypothetical protein